MKRITIDENIYVRFKELCSTNGSTQADMLGTLMDSYASVGCASTSTPDFDELLVERISSLEIELLELRNQLIS